MPQNAFFLRTRDLLISPKTTQRPFLFTLHPLSTVIFATATVLPFVLLRNSNFNFHCYTQREATRKSTQKSARKCAATSRDFFREKLQSAFTLANQLRWIARIVDRGIWKERELLNSTIDNSSASRGFPPLYSALIIGTLWSRNTGDVCRDIGSILIFISTAHV